MRTFILFLPALFFWASCGDCVQHARGKVIDAATGRPVVGAGVYKNSYRGKFNIQTDSTGSFELSGISGGFFSCPPMTVTVEKENYEPLKTRMSGTEIKILKLVPSK